MEFHPGPARKLYDIYKYDITTAECTVNKLTMDRGTARNM